MRAAESSGRQGRLGRPRSGEAAVFVAEEGLLHGGGTALDAHSMHWRPQVLAALRDIHDNGYVLMLVGRQASRAAWPAGRSVAFDQALLDRLAREASVPVAGMLAHAGPADLPQRLREAAAAHGLDLHLAWFLSCADELGSASRRVGCRTLRLLEPGRQPHRRWPLLRGQSRMKLMEAATYLLRCDGRSSADPGDPASGSRAPHRGPHPGPDGPRGSGPKARGVSA